MEQFFSRLQGKAENRRGEDKVIWLETKSGTFSIESVYFALES